eukprot:1002512-Alexandrium_andersonii.AAC.1
MKLSQNVKHPHYSHGLALKRLVRYILDTKDSYLLFPRQGDITAVDVFTDSDWAGDKVKRRSTSSGK